MHYLLFILTASLFTSTNLNNEVLWHKRSKLTWYDFQVVDIMLDEPDLKAISFVSIRSNEGFVGDSLEIEVSCYFDSDQSTVERGAMTSELLIHEQGHFDLGEIYARELRARYSKLNFTRDNFVELDGVATIKSIYDKVYADLQAAQSEYDTQTNHGTNLAAQRLWSKKILEQLYSTDN